MPSSEVSSAPALTLAGTSVSVKPPNSTTAEPDRRRRHRAVGGARPGRDSRGRRVDADPLGVAARQHDVGGAGVDHEAHRPAVDLEARRGSGRPSRGGARWCRRATCTIAAGSSSCAQHVAEAVGDHHHGEDQRPDREVAQAAAEPAAPAPERRSRAGRRGAARGRRGARRVSGSRGIAQAGSSPRSRSPFSTNCTASAASRMPKSRVSTTMPVCPSSRSIRPPARNSSVGQRQHRHQHEVHLDQRQRVAGVLAWQSRIIVASAPGPAIIGVASGKTEGSGPSSASVAPLAPLGAPLEQHVDRHQEQQQPAGDAEGRQADADAAEQRLAGEAEDREQAEGDEDRAERDQPPLARRSSAGSARRRAAPARSGR